MLLYSGPYSRVTKQAEYAVKQIDVDFKILPHDYKREVKLLQQLNHDNVIKVVKVEQKLDDILIYMPYYPNTLQNYIRDKCVTRTRYGESGVSFVNMPKLSPVVIDNILGQIFESIDYIHSQGIIHRDIKPSNFLLSEEAGDLKVVLCDFSILVLQQENDMIHDVCSGSYKPLELIFGMDYGFEIDIWALGILILMLYSNNGDTVLNNHKSQYEDPEELTDFLLIDKIFHVFGTPSTTPGVNHWPQVFEVENFQIIKLSKRARQPATAIFPQCQDPNKLELFDNICNLNPQTRPTMTQIKQTWYNMIK